MTAKEPLVLVFEHANMFVASNILLAFVIGLTADAKAKKGQDKTKQIKQPK